MLTEYLNKVVSGRDLYEEEARACMQDIIEGRSSSLQVASLLTALKVKGETVNEITGFVKAMREASVKVKSDKKLIDTCGTGGDTLKTFNVSTASAIIAASCGVTVAKHGNRSITSKCGGADILEALGVNINCKPPEVSNCLDKVGVGFMYAPLFHPAMTNVAPVRNELGIPTIFNILGPLTSPAAPQMHLLGVFNADFIEPMATVLQNLGVKRAMVVHGYDHAGNSAMDEISTLGRTRVALIRGSQMELFELFPEDFGVKVTDRDSIMATESLIENLEIFNGVIRGNNCKLMAKSRLDLCLVNTAAVLYLAKKESDLEKCVELAYSAVQEGKAVETLDEFKRISNQKIEA